MLAVAFPCAQTNVVASASGVQVRGPEWLGGRMTAANRGACWIVHCGAGIAWVIATKGKDAMDSSIYAQGGHTTASLECGRIFVDAKFAHLENDGSGGDEIDENEAPYGRGGFTVCPNGMAG